MKKSLTLSNIYDFANQNADKYNLLEVFSGIKKLTNDQRVVDYDLLYHLNDTCVVAAVKLLKEFLEINNPEWTIFYYDKDGYGEKESAELLTTVMKKCDSGKLYLRVKDCCDFLESIKWFAFKWEVHRHFIKVDKHGFVSSIRIYDLIQKLDETSKTAKKEIALLYEMSLLN